MLTWYMSIPAKMDERRKVIEYFQKNSVFIQSEAVDFIVEQGQCLRNAKKVLDCYDEKPLNILLDDVQEILDGRQIAEVKPKPMKAPVTSGSHIEIIEDVTGNSCCEGSMYDFATLFKDRYERLYNLLHRRQEMKNVVLLKNARQREGEISVIGMVSGINRSKNGRVLVDIEDESDTATVYIPEEKMGVAASLVEDEVIGITGKSGRGGLLIAESIIRPDIPVNKKKQTASGEGYVAFLSDVHIGSKTFLQEEWQHFVLWVSGKAGNERQRKVAQGIKYLILPGDIVEGIGIYPHQEEDLLIEDIYGQYEALAREFQSLPDHITVIMQPGNHDAVRLALPQPAFENDVRDIFSDVNALFIGNPCYLSVEGVEMLIYHGQSLFDFSTRLGIDQNRPTDIMKIMLQCRHLAPVYGDVTPLAPERKDYMVIDRVPDIFVTGHVHTTALDRYRGVLLINASTWQAQTEYQKMMNFVPDPAKVPIVNLQNGHASLMDFGR